MKVDIKPEKVKNFYALMATFLIVCESMLVFWMVKSEYPIEKIIAGICSVALMALFLIIVFKVENHSNSAEDNNIDVQKEEENKRSQIKVVVLDLILKEMKRSNIENHDLVNLQQVEKLQRVLQLLDHPDSSDLFPQNSDDSADILTDIIKQIR